MENSYFAGLRGHGLGFHTFESGKAVDDNGFTQERVLGIAKGMGRQSP